MEKWTKKKCLEEAKKYKEKSDFRKNCTYIYKLCCKNGWIEEATKHMSSKYLAHGYWTKKKLFEEAKKYKTKSEFQKSSKSAYSTLHKRGLLDQACKHMTQLQKPHGYWTKEKCHKAALKYNKRIDFQKNERSAHSTASRNGWLEEICQHMGKTTRLGQNAYWTRDKCQKEALKYKYRREFREKSPGAWAAANKKGWMEEICRHMDALGNRHKRYIYAFEFSDKSVYVGLSYDPETRYEQHLRNTKKIIKKSKENDLLFVIYEPAFSQKEAKEQESLTIEDYRNKGWCILNSAKAGALGGEHRKWTKEVVSEIAQKYDNYSEFCKNERGAYRAAHSRGWLDELCGHMKRSEKKKGFWTYERCLEAAKKAGSIRSLRDESGGAWGAAQRNGWIPRIRKKLGIK